METLENLLTQFEELRQKLNSFDSSNPLTTQSFIDISQKLDQIHNKILAITGSKKLK